MDVNVSGTVTRIDKDNDALALTGSLSDPVIPAPPQLTVADVGLEIGQRYQIYATYNGQSFPIGTGGLNFLDSVNSVGVWLRPWTAGDPEGLTQRMFMPWTGMAAMLVSPVS